MKKQYYYFIFLILNISFLFAQDDLSEPFLEEQDNQEISSQSDSSITNPSESSPNNTLTSQDSSTRK